MQDPDKFGFYQVGELKFYSKLEAIELYQRTGIHPHWNFNDQVYSSYNWLQEPKESLSDLYRQRAQQLRDSYDYLVLWYSGGADCDNILHAFVDNDILLDEAASYINFDATKDKFDATNGEIFNVACPKLKKIREIAPHLTHRVIDFCQLTMDWFGDSTNQDWMYQLNTIATASNASRQEIYKLVPEWQKMIDRGLRIGFITGIDKPRIMQNPDSSYVFRFIDMIDSGCTANQQQTNPDWFHPEFFYWTPDAPKIVIKQTHVIKNYLKQANQHSAWINKKRSDLAYKIIDGERWWLSQDGMHTLLYPKWQATPYQIKPQSALFVFRDDWFRQLNDDNLSFKVYKMGVEKRWTMVPDYWKNDPANIHKGYKCCFSREYNVGQ